MTGGGTGKLRAVHGRDRRPFKNDVITASEPSIQVEITHIAALAATKSTGGASIALGGVLSDEDFPLAGMIGLADDAFFLHALHQRGGAIISDLQAPLNVAGGGFAVAHDHLDC